MRILLAIFLMTAAGLICAAPEDPDYKKWVNQKIEVISVQDLHSTVRTGLFCEYAKPDVDHLQAGEKLLVLETKIATCGFFKTQPFLRVKRLGTGVSSDKSEGFIRVEPSQNKVRIIAE